MSSGRFPAGGVIVGNGAVGAMFARILGPCMLIDVAGGPGTVRGDITEPGSLTDVLSEARCIVLAVPERIALEALPALEPMLSPGTVLAQTLSVQSRFAEAARQLDPAIEVVGINPMFGPSLDPKGRAIATVVVNGGPAVEALLDKVAGSGARLVRLGADAHDQLMASAQALTHAAVLAFGTALVDLDVDIETLAAIAPPPHATLLALLARIVGGTPGVYRDIQESNPYASGARAALADGVRALEARDVEHVMARAEEYLGGTADSLRARCARIFEAPWAHTAPEQATQR